MAIEGGNASEVERLAEEGALDSDRYVRFQVWVDGDRSIACSIKSTCCDNAVVYAMMLWI